MLRIKAISIGFLASMLLPLAAHAQGGNSGSIVGYIYDQTGNPIKGVKLTASSPTQIGGGRSTYSNEEGYFRFSALFPGVFEVRATAPKLRTYIQKEIKVGISAAAEISLVMEVESAGVEEVKVVEKAPTVSTTTSNVKEVYDLDFVESMPFNSRDQVFNQMVGQIGGAVGDVGLAVAAPRRLVAVHETERPGAGHDGRRRALALGHVGGLVDGVLEQALPLLVGYLADPVARRACDALREGVDGNVLAAAAARHAKLDRDTLHVQRS